MELRKKIIEIQEKAMKEEDDNRNSEESAIAYYFNNLFKKPKIFYNFENIVGFEDKIMKQYQAELDSLVSF